MLFARADDAHLFHRKQGRGAPLLMIMGLGATHHARMAQVPSSSRRSRTVTYDCRGLGRSREAGERYARCALVSDTVALPGHLKIERARVLGFSLEGAVAQEPSVEHPDRVRGLVRAATLARGRSVEVSPELRRALGVGPGDDLGTVRAGELQVDFARGMSAMTRASFGNPIARWCLAALPHQLGAIISPDGVRRQGLAALRIDRMDRLHRIQAPMPVFAGTED